MIPNILGFRKKALHGIHFALQKDILKSSPLVPENVNLFRNIVFSDIIT